MKSQVLYSLCRCLFVQFRHTCWLKHIDNFVRDQRDKQIGTDEVNVKIKAMLASFVWFGCLALGCWFRNLNFEWKGKGKRLLLLPLGLGLGKVFGLDKSWATQRKWACKPNLIWTWRGKKRKENKREMLRQFLVLFFLAFKIKYRKGKMN